MTNVDIEVSEFVEHITVACSFVQIFTVIGRSHKTVKTSHIESRSDVPGNTPTFLYQKLNVLGSGWVGRLEHSNSYVQDKG